MITSRGTLRIERAPVNRRPICGSARRRTSFSLAQNRDGHREFVFQPLTGELEVGGNAVGHRQDRARGDARPIGMGGS